VNEDSLRQLIRRELEKEIAGDAFQSGRMGITANKKRKMQKHDSVCKFCGSHGHTTKECPMLYDSSLREKIEAKDYAELRDIIRSEIASVMYDLFKKRQVWV
jgi:hypothetical protein